MSDMGADVTNGSGRFKAPSRTILPTVSTPQIRSRALKLSNFRQQYPREPCS